MFGASLEGDLDKAGKGHKGKNAAKMAEAARTRTLAKWMGDSETGAFRKPVATRE